ncbi:MAG: LysR family transcriptional regulator [Steroidobacteraceae bacterium]
MPRTDGFSGLSEFLAVARYGSFRRAAHALGVTPGAVSQAVQALERRLGVPVFLRTTRSVALTEAGERLRSGVGPAAQAITESLAELAQMGAAPSGTLRLLVQRFAVAHVIEPVIPRFRRAYPAVRLEMTVEDDHGSLVGAGYDAGVRIGEYIDRDMVAVRVSPLFRWLVFGSPAYFAAHGRPKVPEDIAAHECIRYRRPEVGDIYRWEFARKGQAVAIDPPGSVLVNDGALLRALARQGLGLIYTATLSVAQELEQGLLEPVLEKFSPARDGIFIYYPRASRNQLKLRAFVEACTRGL